MLITLAISLHYVTTYSFYTLLSRIALRATTQHIFFERIKRRSEVTTIVTLIADRPKSKLISDYFESFTNLEI